MTIPAKIYHIVGHAVRADYTVSPCCRTFVSIKNLNSHILNILSFRRLQKYDCFEVRSRKPGLIISACFSKTKWRIKSEDNKSINVKMTGRSMNLSDHPQGES